jgi:hypothetical protein
MDRTTLEATQRMHTCERNPGQRVQQAGWEIRVLLVASCPAAPAHDAVVLVKGEDVHVEMVRTAVPKVCVCV